MPSIRSGRSIVRASACIDLDVRGRPDVVELRQPLHRVGRVPAQEVIGPLDRAALAPVLVARVRPEDRRAGHVEVVVRREPRRPGGARGDHRERLGLSRARDGAAEPGEVAKRRRRVPAREPLRRRRVGRRRVERPVEVEPERRQVVPGDLHSHEEAVERRDVGADRVDPERVRLDERRPRPRERVVDDGPGREAAAKQRLGELRHELPEVGVQAMDVLRPHVLRQVALRPRELVVDLGVERRLCTAGHGR